MPAMDYDSISTVEFVDEVAKGFSDSARFGRARLQSKVMVKCRAAAYGAEFALPQRLKRSVNVPGQNAQWPRMRGDQCAESSAPFAQRHVIQGWHSGWKRGVMHEDQGQTLAGLRQPFLQPVELRGPQGPLDVTVFQCIKRKNAHIAKLHLIVEKRPRPEGQPGPEGRAQTVAPVMVSRNDEDRHVKRRQDIAQKRIVVGGSPIGQIAGEHDSVDPGRECGKVSDHFACCGGSVRPHQGRFRRMGEDMEI